MRATRSCTAPRRNFLEKFGLKDLAELPPIEEFAPDSDTERAIRDRLSTGDGPVFGAEDAADDDVELVD